MKKPILWILLIALLLPAGACAMVSPESAVPGEGEMPVEEGGEIKVDEKEVVRLKKLFSITKEYENFNVRKMEEEGHKALGYQWYDDEGEITLMTDDKGTVLHYDKTLQGEKRGMANPKGMEPQGEKWLKKLAPDAGEYRPDRNLYRLDWNGRVTYGYQRYVNDLPVLGDVIDLSLKIDTGELVSYHRSYPLYKAGDFPKFTGDLAKVKKAYEEQLGIRRGFEVTREGPEEYTTEALYASLYPQRVLDTKTLLSVPRRIDNRPMEDNMKEAAMAEDSGGGLTSVEQKAIKTVKGMMTREEAIKRANEFFSTKGYETRRASLGKQGPDYFWTLNFVREDKDNYKDASFVLNGKTRDLAHLHITPPTVKGEPKEEVISGEPGQALLKKAAAFTERAEKGLMKRVSQKDALVEKRYLSTVILPRLEEGWYYFGENVELEIHGPDGKIYGFDKNFTPVKGTAPKEDIGLSKAREIAAKEGEEGLLYMVKDKKITIVYGMKNPVTLKADKGTVVRREKTPLTYSDLTDAKYPEIMELLGMYGIGFEGGKLLPKEKMTKEDLFQVLTQWGGQTPKQRWEPLKDFLGEKEFKPEEPASVVYAIKVLYGDNNFPKLDRMKNVFNESLFKDAKTYTDEEKAYLYTALGLGYLERKGELKGKEAITREDFLYMYYQISENR